eukprot:Opistho-1_new@17980
MVARFSLQSVPTTVIRSGANQPYKVVLPYVHCTRRRLLTNFHIQVSSVCDTVVDDAYELYGVLMSLVADNDTPRDSSTLPSQVVVVDSIAAPCSVLLGHCPQGHALLASIGILLRRLSFSGAVVLTTNHLLSQVSTTSTEEKASLGATWTQFPSTRILTSICRESSQQGVAISLECLKTLKMPPPQSTALIVLPCR